MSSPDLRVRELRIELPAPPAAVGAYQPVTVVGDMLYTSGVLPVWNGELRYAGVVGGDLNVADGAEAARLCVLNLLALLRHHIGSLDAIRQVVQLTGFVRSAPGFGQQPKVLNAASDLLFQVFGERGRHTRTALGTSDLPLGAAVEVSSVFRVFRDLVARPVPSQPVARTAETTAPAG